MADSVAILDRHEPHLPNVSIFIQPFFNNPAATFSLLTNIMELLKTHEGYFPDRALKSPWVDHTLHHRHSPFIRFSEKKALPIMTITTKLKKKKKKNNCGRRAPTRRFSHVPPADLNVPFKSYKSNEWEKPTEDDNFQ